MRILLKAPTPPAESVRPRPAARGLTRPVRREVLEVEAALLGRIEEALSAIQSALESDGATSPDWGCAYARSIEELETRLRIVHHDSSLEPEESERIRRALVLVRSMSALARIPSQVGLPLRMLQHVSSGVYLKALLSDAVQSVGALGDAAVFAYRNPNASALIPGLRRHSEAWTSLRSTAIRSSAACPRIPFRVFRAALISLGVVIDLLGDVLNTATEALEAAENHAA